MMLSIQLTFYMMLLQKSLYYLAYFLHISVFTVSYVQIILLSILTPPTALYGDLLFFLFHVQCFLLFILALPRCCTGICSFSYFTYSSMLNSLPQIMYTTKIFTRLPLCAAGWHEGGRMFERSEFAQEPE